MNHAVKTGKGKDNTILLILFLFAIFLLLHPSQISISVQKGLFLFYKNLLPSLFPLSVLCNLFVVAGKIPFLPTKMLSKVFHISRASTVALFFGLFAGFPVGALAVGTLVKEGSIEREEGERLLGICSNAGAAFLIGGVGSLMGNYKMGLLLYVSQTVASLLVGLWGRRGHDPIQLEMEQSHKLTLADFSHAVKSSSVAMITVCGFVTFFTVVGDFLSQGMESLGLPSILSALVQGFLEISSGMQKVAALTGIWKYVLSGLLVGWSGISVHMQISAVCGGLSMKRYIHDRLLISLLCACFHVLNFVIWN